MSHPHTALGFSDEELEKTLESIDISLNLYIDESDRRSLGAPFLHTDARVIISGRTTTITCPTSEQEVAVRYCRDEERDRDGGSDPIVQAERGFVLRTTWPSSF